MVSKRETATRKKSLQSRPVVKHTMLYEILKRGGLMNKLMSPTCCAHDAYRTKFGFVRNFKKASSAPVSGGGFT